MAKAWIGSLVGLSSSPGAARTPQCHDDVITAVGAEAFAPVGGGGGSDLSVTQRHPQRDFKTHCSPWFLHAADRQLTFI